MRLPRAFGQVRGQIQRAAETRDRFLMSPQFAQRGAEVVVRGGADRREIERGVEGCNRAVEVIQMGEEIAEVACRRGVVGLAPERRTVGVHRFLVAALTRVRFAEGKPRGRTIAMHVQHCMADADCFHRAPDSIERKSPSAVKRRAIRRDRDRAVRPLDYGLPVAPIKGQHGEVIPHRGVARLLREAFAIARIRLGVTASLMVLDGAEEHLRIDHARSVAPGGGTDQPSPARRMR